MAVNYRVNAEKARAVAESIVANGGTALAMQADMSRVAEAQRLVQDTVNQFHHLDILINNAGRFLPKSMEDTTEADFDAIIALNAKGPYFAMQAAAKSSPRWRPDHQYLHRSHPSEFSWCDGALGKQGGAGTVW